MLQWAVCLLPLRILVCKLGILMTWKSHLRLRYLLVPGKMGQRLFFMGRVFMQAIRSGRQWLPPSFHKRNFFSLPNVVPDIFDSRKIYSERKLLKYIMEWTTFSKFFHAVHYLLILWLQLFPSSSIRGGFKCNGLPPIYTILYSFQSIFIQICDFCHCTRPCGYGGRTRSRI